MRKMCFCLLAAGVLGAAAPALGNEGDRSAPRGGIDVGPFGQCFDRMHPWECRGYGRGRYSYGFVPSYRFRYYRHHRYLW